MIEVFKITHNIHNTTVSHDISFNEKANTRGNHTTIKITTEFRNVGDTAR